MSIHTIPVSRPLSQPGILSRPLQTILSTLAMWRARHRQRADTALLKSMEPHMLDDIGISLAGFPHQGGSVLTFHPAVLATTVRASLEPKVGSC